jgi:hypothetical protein
MNQLDVLATEYLNGDQTAFEKICKLVLPHIERESEKLWRKVENNTKFECRCLVKLKNLLEKFNPQEQKFSNLVFATINRESSDFKNRRKSKEYSYIDDLAVVDDEGNRTEYLIIDKTQNLEDSVVESESIKEKIALLAQGDSKRRMILYAWINGYTNDSELASMLAHRFPNTKPESHRKLIYRFRQECQERLADVN